MRQQKKKNTTVFFMYCIAHHHLKLTNNHNSLAHAVCHALIEKPCKLPSSCEDNIFYIDYHRSLM